jgi:hypothetical protein
MKKQNRPDVEGGKAVRCMTEARWGIIQLEVPLQTLNAKTRPS